MTRPESILDANIARYRHLLVHETDAARRASLEEAIARDLLTQESDLQAEVLEQRALEQTQSKSQKAAKP